MAVEGLERGGGPDWASGGRLNKNHPTLGHGMGQGREFGWGPSSFRALQAL